MGSYYSLDFHLPTYVIISCKCNSYYICGKLCVMFVVGSCYYVCGKFITFVGHYITFKAADLYCGLLCLWAVITFVGVTLLRLMDFSVRLLLFWRGYGPQ